MDTQHSNGFRIREAFFWILFGMVVLAFLGVIGLAWYPYNPIRIDLFTANKAEVCQGEKLCFTVIAEKFYAAKAKVTIELANSENFLVMSYPVDNPPGPINKTRCFIVPFIEPKVYQIRWTIEYDMNPLNHPRVVTMSNPVLILSALRGSKGDRDKGDKGDKGDTGGISIFGKGEKGDRGPKGDKGNSGKKDR